MIDVPLFIEVAHAQCRKAGQNICGDAFYSEKEHNGHRVVSVLSDGLGSGVKANILASMTSRMAVRFVTSDMDFVHSAAIMMDALPVCQVRKISYATFTIIDTRPGGDTRIIEMDNPSFVLLRNGEVCNVPSEEVASPRWSDRKLRFSRVKMQADDRIVIYSDGISQAGLGTSTCPLGWRERGCREFLVREVEQDPNISARHLSDRTIRAALSREPHRHAQDDMTCGVIYFRRPRKLLVVSGPPFNKRWDAQIARMLDAYDGKRAICGGTTANIIARELNRKIHMDLALAQPDLPPPSSMDGADLVTEGILTLTNAARLLEEDVPARGKNPAATLVELFRESDIIEFLVGSRINEAHQDPTLPLDIEIRRNIVRRIAQQLETKYLKEVSIKCI